LTCFSPTSFPCFVHLYHSYAVLFHTIVFIPSSHTLLTTFHSFH
jgi:hypothetical protein